MKAHAQRGLNCSEDVRGAADSRRAWPEGAAGGQRGWHAFVRGAAGAASRQEGRPEGGRAARRQARGRAARGVIFIWSCRVMRRGASVPRQDRWRGRPCHVTGQRPDSRHVTPLAAPGTAKSVSFEKKNKQC